MCTTGTGIRSKYHTCSTCTHTRVVHSFTTRTCSILVLRSKNGMYRYYMTTQYTCMYEPKKKVVDYYVCINIPL